MFLGLSIVFIEGDDLGIRWCQIGDIIIHIKS